MAMPEEEMLERAAHRQVHRALEQLPGPQREVLRRSYFSGQTLQEIAEHEQVPLGTVKTRVRLALEKLRGMIGGRRDQ